MAANRKQQALGKRVNVFFPTFVTTGSLRNWYHQMVSSIQNSTETRSTHAWDALQWEVHFPTDLHGIQMHHRKRNWRSSHNSWALNLHWIPSSSALTCHRQTGSWFELPFPEQRSLLIQQDNYNQHICSFHTGIIPSKTCSSARNIQVMRKSPAFSRTLLHWHSCRSVTPPPGQQEVDHTLHEWTQKSDTGEVPEGLTQN